MVERNSFVAFTSASNGENSRRPGLMVAHTTLMGGLMRLRKLLVAFAAVVMPMGTLIGAGGVAVQPANAAVNLLYCTGGKGVVNFKQTTAPATPNGLTQLGYYEATSAKVQTTVTGVTG